LPGRGIPAPNHGRIVMRTRIAMGVVCYLGLSFLMVPAPADDEKITFDKLPAAVRKAVKRKFPKAEIEQVVKEVEDGKTIYEVALEIKDRAVDVALAADGTILVIEREIPFEEVPKAVKKALAAKYPKAKIDKVEEVMKGEDGPVRYEVAVTTEVVLTAGGRFVGAEEEDDEKPSTKVNKSKKHKDEDDDDDDDKDKVKAEKDDRN
jgi:TATA-binding protein-associated factor Taf7